MIKAASSTQAQATSSPQKSHLPSQPPQPSHLQASHLQPSPHLQPSDRSSLPPICQPISPKAPDFKRPPTQLSATLMGWTSPLENSTVIDSRSRQRCGSAAPQSAWKALPNVRPQLFTISATSTTTWKKWSTSTRIGTHFAAPHAMTRYSELVSRGDHSHSLPSLEIVRERRSL